MAEAAFQGEEDHKPAPAHQVVVAFPGEAVVGPAFQAWEEVVDRASSAEVAPAFQAAAHIAVEAAQGTAQGDPNPASVDTAPVEVDPSSVVVAQVGTPASADLAA